jgi:hypothetical protein
MSYSHHFSGVVFFTDTPFPEVAGSFQAFCEECSGRLNEGDLIIHHENEDETDWRRVVAARHTMGAEAFERQHHQVLHAPSKNRDGEPTEVEVYIHHWNIDGKVTYALMEWVQGLMRATVGGKKQVVRVYCSSSSDAVKDDPFFYVVTRQAIDAISVDDLFRGRKLKLQRQSAD